MRTKRELAGGQKKKNNISRDPRPRAPRLMALAAAATSALASLHAHSAHAGLLAWDTGGNSNSNFSGANWSATNTPASGGAVTGSSPSNLFFGNATSINLTDDLVGATFGNSSTTPAFTFLAGGNASFVIGGNSFTLAGNISNLGTNLQTINDNFSTTAVQTVTLTAGGGNVFLGGNISGTAGGLTLAGNGTLTLAGSNSYTGAITIGAATTLQLQANATNTSSGTSSVMSTQNMTVAQLPSGATIQLRADSGVASGGAVGFDSGATSFGVNSAGAKITGTINFDVNQLSAGNGSNLVLKFGSPTASWNVGTAAVDTFNVTGGNGYTLQLGAFVVGNNSSLVFNPSTANMIIGGISNGSTGTITKTGAGNLTILGSVTQTGATTISAGTLLVGNGTAGSYSSNTNTINIAAAGTFALNEVTGTTNSNVINNAGLLVGAQGNNITNTLTGNISGVGNVTQNGAGTMVLAFAETYTGATTVNAGTLQLGNGTAGSLGNTSVTVAGGTFLVKGNSTIGSGAGSLKLNDGGTFSMADGSINTLTLNGALTLGNSTGGALSFEVGGNGIVGSADELFATGATTLNGNNTINITTVAGGTLTTGNYTLISGTGLSPTNFQLGINPSSGFTSVTLFGNSTTEGVSVVAPTVVNTLYWTGNASQSHGDTNNNWGFGNGTVGSNWSGSPSGSTDALQTPTSVADIFFTAGNNQTGNLSGAVNTQLDTAYVVKGLFFDTSPTGGNVTSVGINTNGNTLTIGADGLTVQSTDASNTTISGSGAVIVGASEIWANNSNTQSLTISAPIGSAAGTNTLTLGGNGSQPIVLNGNISNGNGTLTVTNATGTTTLGGVNSYTGGTNVGNGTINVTGSLNMGSIGSINVATGATNIGTLNISGNLTALNLNVGGGSANVFGAGGAGAVYQTGGNVTFNGSTDTNFDLGGFKQGTTGCGYYNISGGNLTVAQIDDAARAINSIGVMDVTGGTVNGTSGISLGRGNNGGAFGILNVTGNGTVLSQGNNPSGSIELGFGALGLSVLSIGGSGSTAASVVAGNTTANSIGVNLQAVSGNSTSVLNLLPHGTLNTTSLVATTALTSPGVTLLNFNGGTLQAASTNAGANFLPAANITGVYVYGGNGTIDNNGTNITIGAGLLAPTGSGANGNPTVASGGSGYIGAPLVTVTDSGATGVGATAYATINPSGNVTGIVVTNPGINYSGNLSFTLTGGGGSGATVNTLTQTADTSGGITFQGGGITTLTANNTYSGGTTLNAGGLTIDHSGNNTGALGNGTLTVNSGALLVKGNTTIGTSGGAGLSLHDAGSFSMVDGTINALTLNGNGVLGSSAGSALNFEISGDGSNSANDTADVLTITGTASGSGNNTINITEIGILTSGNYTLITAGSGLSGVGFHLGTTPGGAFTSAVLSNSTDTSEILTLTLPVASSTLYWTGNASVNHGDSNNLWGFGNGTVGSNWSSDKPGANDALQTPLATEDVFFTANNATPVSGVVSTQLDASYSVNGLHFDTSTATNAITSVSINTNGQTLTIGGNGTTVASGDTSNSIISGSGAVIIGTSQNWANNAANNISTLTVSAPVQGAAGNNTLTVNGTGTGGVTLSGNISNGAGVLALLFNQAGTTTLSGSSNSYTGGTTINGGTVAISNANSLGATAGNLTINAGTLQATANIASARNIILGDVASTIQVDPGMTYTASVPLSGSGNLTKTGNGTLAIVGTNSYAGSTTITAGTLSGATDFGQANSNVVVSTAGTLNYSGGVITNTITGTGNVTNSGVVTITGNNTAFNGTWTANNNQWSINSPIVGGNSTGTSANAAYVNNFPNNTNGFIFGSGGTFTVNLGSLSGVANSVVRGASLSPTFGTITLSVGNLNTNTTYAGGIWNNGGSGSNVVALTKVGSGSLTLTGSSTYTGGTTIAGGTIFADAAGNSLGVGNVTVASGGTLSGNGSTGPGAVTVNAGGTITGGADAVTAGILHTDLTVNGNATITSRVFGITGNGNTTATAGTDYDQVADAAGITTLAAAGGSPTNVRLTLPNGNSTANFNSAGNYSFQVLTFNAISLPNATAPGNGTTTILATDGGPGAPAVTAGYSGLFTLDTTAFASSSLGTNSNGSFALELVVAGGGNGDLEVDYNSFNATPEPGTALLVLGGGLPMLMSRRRRKYRPQKSESC